MMSGLRILLGRDYEKIIVAGGEITENTAAMDSSSSRACKHRITALSQNVE